MVIKTWPPDKETKKEQLKKQLSDLYFTKIDIEGKIKLWQELIETARDNKAIVYSDMPHGSDTSDPTFQTILQIQKHQEQIKALESQLEEEMQNFENLTKHLSSKEKAILTWRYINNLYWDKMEGKVHYSKSQCKKIHNKALIKIVEELEKNNNNEPK